ncbi:uncharacterized protein [Amphiura filiformis]|uniref:uncharacterized protein n=1 Tax=Amphiura filiformis TaxID=82378 RepID=UPI003B21DE38
MGGMRMVPLYSVSKAAVNAFSINIALYDPTAHKKKVRVNMVCPLKVDKPVAENRQYAKPEQRKELQDMTADPEKKAAFAMLICSIQDVANAMLMCIEEDHNGKTALVFSETYPIVDDAHQQFRKEVLKMDDDHFQKIMGTISAVQTTGV